MVIKLSEFFFSFLFPLDMCIFKKNYILYIYKATGIIIFYYNLRFFFSKRFLFLLLQFFCAEKMQQIKIFFELFGSHGQLLALDGVFGSMAN
jgi:hypothetical protein